MNRRRRWVLGIALLSPAWSPLTAPAQSPTPASDWQSAVRGLLTQRAEAVQRGDLRAFLDTMKLASPEFIGERRTWFERLRRLPLGSYTLTMDADEFGDLARPIDVARYGGEVHVVQVKERIGFKDFDRAPSNEDLYLTIRSTGSGWSIVSDTDLEDIALLSMRNIWEFGPVEHISRDRVLVMFHPAQRTAAQTVLTESIQARESARRTWPFPWRDPIIVMIPGTADELARVLQTQFDLSAFVAFAASSLDRERGWALSGDRIFLHTPNYTRYGGEFRRLILQHEFTHLATRATTGPYVPAFMDEGTAVFYGEGGSAAPALRARIRGGAFDGKLPEDWVFISESREEIDFAYEASTSFIAYLVRRFGRDTGARAYTSLARENPIDAGTWRYHLDRAFRTALRAGFEDVQRGWADSVRKEFA